SDEQIIGRNEIPEEDLKEIREMGYAGINFNDTAEKGTGVLTKIRRILEVQSDLFQKGRSKSKLAQNKINFDNDYFMGDDFIEDKTGNQFLQLLNKDNNWVTFFVKSIIQDSAKKGY